MKGSRRRLSNIAPVSSIHGYVGQTTSGKRYPEERYGGAPKVYGFTRLGGSRNFFAVKTQLKMKYSTPAIQEAAEARQAKFKAVTQATSERLANPTLRAQDELAFTQQSEYKTLFGFVFHLEWEAYDD